MNQGPSPFSDAGLSLIVFFAALSWGCLGSRATTGTQSANPPVAAALGWAEDWVLKTPPNTYIPKGMPPDAPLDAFNGDWMHLEKGNFFIPQDGTPLRSHRQILDQVLALRTEEEIKRSKIDNSTRAITYAAAGTVNPVAWFSSGCGQNRKGE